MSWILIALQRLVPGQRHQNWSTSIDVTLAIFSGFLSALLCAFFLSKFHLGETFIGADFHEYCASIGALRDQDFTYWSRNRSILAALPAAILAKKWGIIDGLSLSALASTSILGIGLYLWGRALHSRMAGLASVLVMGAFNGLAVIPRILSFYPGIIASTVLCMAGAALALRYKNWISVFFSGITIGLTLLMDLRGLTFALVGFTLTILAIILSKRKRFLLLLVLLLPITSSYFTGQFVYVVDTTPLEGQADALRRNRLQDLHIHPIPPGNYESAYVWGRSSPLTIPNTLISLTKLQKAIPKQARDLPEIAEARTTHLYPLVFPFGVMMVIGVVGLWRKPDLLLGYLGTILPFLISLNASVTVEYSPRFFSAALPLFPIVFGVFFGTCSDGIIPGRLFRKQSINYIDWLPWASPKWYFEALRLATGSAIVLILVLGIIPSFLSPIASWRVQYGGQKRHIEYLTNIKNNPKYYPDPSKCNHNYTFRCMEAPCAVQIKKDLANDLGFEGTLY